MLGSSLPNPHLDAKIKEIGAALEFLLLLHSKGSPHQNPIHSIARWLFDMTTTLEEEASSTATCSRLGSPEPTLKRPAPFANDQETAQEEPKK
jgi:hypothetical protein